MMELHFTNREIAYLWHTAQESFYPEQWLRFDVNGDEIFPTEGGVLVWCGQQYLNAKIIAEHYRANNQSLRTSIMWDEAMEGEWVVWLDVESIEDL
jgi:hypothetical protein